MKALQVVQPRLFERVEVPIPHLSAETGDRILVRTEWVSLCGSDIPFFTGNKRFRSYPLAVGAPIHECVGTVAESTSKLFKSGDKVLAIPEGDQGLAECFVALSSKAVKLDPAISDAGAACIIQPLSTVMNAMDRMGDIAGQSVAVIGLGSIGLFFCWLAAKRGAGSVVGVDPCAERCRIAESLGANRTISKRSIELIHAARKSPDIWNPPDICVEAVGHQMDTLNDCLELVRKRGSVIAFGVPDHPVYALEYETFFRKNAILIATVTPDWSDYLTQARDLFLANSSALTAGFITHRLPIGEAEKVFEMYERHENGVVKAVLNASCW